MPIYTPRGLKIRLPLPYAFGLMARLQRKVSPFRVLKTTEGIESLPGMLGHIGGIVAFAMRLSPLEIGLVVGGCQLAGVSINLFGLYIFPGLVSLATLYSYIAGYGLFFIAASIVGLVLVGWQGVLAFLLAKFAVTLISQATDDWQMSRCHKLTGQPLTASEIHFLNAYRLHASRIGVTTDIDLSEEEMAESHWLPTFERFGMEWPQVVRRFTPD